MRKGLMSAVDEWRPGEYVLDWVFWRGGAVSDCGGRGSVDDGAEGVWVGWGQQYVVYRSGMRNSFPGDISLVGG